MKKSCFFIGHRDSSWELYPLVKAEIINHIENYGVTEFIVGKYGAFDSICASALSRIKQDYPHIKLYLLLLTVTAMPQILPGLSTMPRQEKAEKFTLRLYSGK